MQPRSRRHALVGVTCATVSLLENRIHGRGKRRSRRLRFDDRQLLPRPPLRTAAANPEPRTQNREPFVFIRYTPHAVSSIPRAALSVRGRVPHETTLDARCCLNAATPAGVTAVSLMYSRCSFDSFASATSVRSPMLVLDRSRLMMPCSDSSPAAAESLMPSAFQRLNR
jgi:hypothetical protein